MWWRVSSLLLILSLFSRQGFIEGKLDDEIVDGIIQQIRPLLRNIFVPHLEFDTKKQEFGQFSGILDNVTITELDKFDVVNLEITVIPAAIKNVTLRFPNFTVRGMYDLNGILIFPIGNEPLRIFGKGGMTIKFGESHFIGRIALGLKGGNKVVKDLDMDFNITTMNVKLENLMGGSILEEVFNKYFSEIGPTIYNYYKADIFKAMKKQLMEEINKLLKEMEI